MKTPKTLKTITKAQFNKLSNPEKRVLIAQDVVAQLEAKKFVQKRGSYFEFEVPDKKLHHYELVKGERYSPLDDCYADSRKESAQKLIKDSTCYVCAKGAAICSFVQKFNEKEISELHEDDDDLAEIFGHNLWQELERHFEGWDGNSQKSLKSLMNNIIENKGFLKINKVLIG